MPQTLAAKPKQFQVEERCGVRPSDCKVSVSAAVIAAFATCVLSFTPGVLAQPDSLGVLLVGKAAFGDWRADAPPRAA
jgi:hypothetical protein